MPSKHDGASPSGMRHATGPAPRRAAIAIPAVIIAAMLGVIAWNAWPVLKPAPSVEVVQAIFDRSAMQEPAAPDASAQRTPTVQAPGWLEAEPFFVPVAALADGVVDRVAVLEGDFVEAGDLVATLVAEDALIRERIAAASVAAAEAGLAAAQAELEAAQQSWESPIALERAVAVGRASVAESEAEEAQLPPLIDAARARLVRLEEEASRVRRSSELGATNDLERIVAEQHVAAQRAEVSALEARGPMLRARTQRLAAELAAAIRDLELRIEDRRRLAATRAAAAQAQGQLARARATHDEATLERTRMTITAPISGFVQRRLKAPGDKVIRMMDDPMSAHLVHLYDPDRLQVRVDVPLADAAHISVGQACEVVVEVLPDRVFKGEVLRITHEADLQKNTLQVKVKVLDPAPILRPEMLTRVKFLGTGSAEQDGRSGASAMQRVLVPREAIAGSEGEPRVLVVTQRRSGRGVLVERPVRIVGERETLVAIEGDIQPGAIIAVGAVGVGSGDRVIIREEASS